jgi:OmpA-OmpF porin, OOP family
MRRSISLLLFFPLFSINAQDSTGVEFATVSVIISDSKGKPRKAETVLFVSEGNGNIFSGRSDGQGKFSIKLPAGARYSIHVIAIVDSSKQGFISIPRLLPGQFFSEPFKVTIKFDPARSYTLDNVEFKFGKATLQAISFPELNELTEYLNDHPSVRIEIAGHTDNIGSNADNLKLSLQRAASIRSWLIKNGISANRIIAKGYGSNEPVADNTTEEGRKKNRRTEVRILSY